MQKEAGRMQKGRLGPNEVRFSILHSAFCLYFLGSGSRSPALVAGR
jgi:hypothetical protein